MSKKSTCADSLDEQHPAPYRETNSHQGIMSVRSFSAFEKEDDDGENGDNVHDILRRRSSLGISMAEAIASPIAFRRIWAETASLTLTDGQPGRQRRRNSIQSNPERGWAGNIIPTAPGDPQSAETRSPSGHNRSSMSPSTESREDSLSSPEPVNGDILHGLQSKGPTEHDKLEPLTEKEIDPASFNLISPCNGQVPRYSLEARSEMLFSKEHLEAIFDDPRLLQRFTNFLYAFRPKSVPVLVYYLDALKALRAINYANAVAQSLVPLKEVELGDEELSDVMNESLRGKANKAFATLAEEDLPAYITHTWTQTVRVTMRKRIMDTLPNHLIHLSEGLAEVFCLTDPSRGGNPVILASKEFHTMTQYGMKHVIGRNSCFLQGPHTNSSSIKRIREHLEAGKEHCEAILNYRRDGSPFMNLLMVAPLIDSRGVIRYHIGAQIDISGLVKECAGLESLERLVSRRHDNSVTDDGDGAPAPRSSKDKFRELAEMFSIGELRTVRESGGSMHSTHEGVAMDTEAGSSRLNSRPLSMNDAGPERRDSDPVLNISSLSGRRLGSVYEDYLLVRPYPSLRVLFASPSLRFPGMLQSKFMSRIGGSQTLRDEIVQAFADGRGATARVRWVTRADNHGKGRWIHSTPLFGSNAVVGVWMVVLIDDDEDATPRRMRVAPPVSSSIGGQKPFDDDTSNAPGPSSPKRAL
ncbi:hypothetical protein F5Y13DRAFT_197709 [Hypoxylon sp. FL1857]|nr:hypothetical protein F5Y13DRAFT_197709 [Hypoxylon sp. FL1857]